MESEDSEAREDSASEDSHPSTDASEDSVEVRVGGVTRPPPPNCNPQPSYSPQRSYSPNRVYSPPLIPFNQNYSSTPKLPPKLRKSFNTLASNTLTQVFKTSPSNQTIAFTAAATFDRIPSPSSKRTLISQHDDVQVHSRRRKLAEPRRVCSELTRKRPHSPSLEERSPSPRLPIQCDIPLRPVKQFKVSTPDPSPPRTSPSPLSMPHANPLLYPGLLSPLVRPPGISPTLSPTLSSALAPHLLPPGWTPTQAYQHYTRLLGSVLPSPLALLPGGIHLPHYPLMPLLHHIPSQESSPPIVQSPPATRSPTPLNYHSTKLKSSEESVRKLLQDTKNEIEKDISLQVEPVSLVTREEQKSQPLFSVASLVEESSPRQPTARSVQFLPTKSKLTSLPSPVPVASDLTTNTRIKEEIDAFNDSSSSLRSTTRLELPPSTSGSSAPSRLQLTSSQLHQQQQQLLRQKQRNYKNMTRERRIEANARERTRVHTISSAYEKLRQSVPSYSHTQKLSKLSILRIAASYILTLSKMTDNAHDNVVADCVEETTRTIQFEGKAKKKRDD